jgi:hypothetical protein
MEGIKTKFVVTPLFVGASTLPVDRHSELLETLTTAFLLLYNFDEVLPGNSDVIG